MPAINDTFIRELWSKMKKFIPHKLNDLDEDCAISSPTENQILRYDGTKWTNSNPQSYSQQQADWNIADNASVSYIKNKPNSLPASDVYSWAKEATKPSYEKSEIGLGNVDNTADVNKEVLSATKLKTARTINTVPFDGTVDITVTEKITNTELEDMLL